MLRKRFDLALAVVLLAAQALLPIAHLGRLHADPLWTAVCTSAGLVRLPGSDAPREGLSHDEHCALCRVAEPVAGAAPFAAPGAAAAAPEAKAATAGAAEPSMPARHARGARAPPAMA